jgi:RimJ/RimL family protein N-acetyltransferase
VLSENVTARRLYERVGFTLVGELPDMYRIGGRSVGHVLMTHAV